MKTKGIRISDAENDVISVDLPDILEEISDGGSYHWSILYFYGSGDLGEGRTIQGFEKEVNPSERGLLIDWEELKLLAKKFYQIYDISIEGAKDRENLRRYKNDQEKYESCDYVIEMIDSGCWEVFSFNLNFIDKLSKKFKDIEFLNSDFQDEWLKKG